MLPKGQCGILRIPPCDHEQRNVQSGWDLGHAEQAQGNLTATMALGDHQDSKNCGNEAAADINVIKCPLVQEAQQ